MTLFVYKKHTLAQAPGEFYVEWYGGTAWPMDSDDEYWGYQSYRIDTNGNIVLEGKHDFVGGLRGGTVYTSYSPKNIGREISNLQDYTHRTDTGVVKQGPPRTVKGAFVEYIIAQEGTYPVDGALDGFWYVQGAAARNPTNLVPNGGESWSGLQTISWNAMAESYRVYYSPNNGNTWTQIGTVSQTSYVFDFSTVQESSLAKVRVDAYSGAELIGRVESNGVFTSIQNVAPTAPSNLLPNGFAVDRTITQRLSWRFNDPNPNDTQSKAEIRWRKQGTIQWTTINLLGSDREYYLPPNTLPAGNIEWQVRTFDQQSLASPWSLIAVFIAAEPSNAPVIISPGSVVGVSRPVVQWTSGAQTVYQIIIEDSSGAVVWDSGNVLSTVKAHTVGIDLINGARYKIKVRIQDGSGLYSSFAEKEILISYTPPSKPIVDVYKLDGGIRLAITNPTPTGTQPNVERMALFKRIGNDFVLFEENITTVYTDYTVVSEAEEQYIVRVYGDNGTYINSDVIFATAPKLRGIWLHDVQDPELTIRQFLLVAKGSLNESFEREHVYRQYAGRKKPVIVYGEQQSRGIKATLDLVRDPLSRQRLIDFVETGAILLYRDNKGRKFYTSLPQIDMQQLFYGHSIPIEFIEIDYDEEV